MCKQIALLRYFGFRKLAAIVLMVSMFPSALAQKQSAPARPQWQSVISKDGGFRVSMPATPKKTVERHDLGSAIMTTTRHAVGVKAGVYSITYSDLPDSSPTEESALDITVQSVHDAMRDEGLTLLSEAKLSLNMHPGREIKAMEPNHTTMVERFYIVKYPKLKRLRLFTLTFRPVQTSVAAANQKQFFASFQLIGAK